MPQAPEPFAQIIILGHAVFAGNSITQYLRTGVTEIAQEFPNWESGAAIFTDRTRQGLRQVHAVILYRLSPESDKDIVVEMMQTELSSNPTLQAVSQIPGISLSTVRFKSPSIPVPLMDDRAELFYIQMYGQYHEGSRA